MNKGTLAQGIDMDMMVALLRQMTQPATLNLLKPQGLTQALEKKACDMVFPVEDTPALADRWTLLRAVPFRYQAYSLFQIKTAQAAPPINRVSALFGMRLGIHPDFKITVGLQQALQDQQFQIERYKDRTEMLTALRQGEINGILDQTIPLTYAAHKENLRNRLQERAITFIPQTPLFLAFSHADNHQRHDAIMRHFQNALTQQHLKGELLRYTAAYFQKD